MCKIGYTLLAIGLINDYKYHKNIYSGNNNVCLGVLRWFFVYYYF